MSALSAFADVAAQVDDAFGPFLENPAMDNLCPAAASWPATSGDPV